MRHNPISVSCVITNTGDRDGYEIAQLYIRDLVGKHTRPIRELKGFQKIFIPAGQSRNVHFTLTREDLKYWHEAHSEKGITYFESVEPGSFEVWVAPNSVSGQSKQFVLK